MEVREKNWDIRSCCLYGSTLFTKSGNEKLLKLARTPRGKILARFTVVAREHFHRVFPHERFARTLMFVWTILSRKGVLKGMLSRLM